MFDQPTKIEFDLAARSAFLTQETGEQWHSSCPAKLGDWLLLACDGQDQQTLSRRLAGAIAGIYEVRQTGPGTVSARLLPPGEERSTAVEKAKAVARERGLEPDDVAILAMAKRLEGAVANLAGRRRKYPSKAAAHRARRAVLKERGVVQVGLECPARYRPFLLAIGQLVRGEPALSLDAIEALLAAAKRIQRGDAKFTKRFNKLNENNDEAGQAAIRGE